MGASSRVAGVLMIVAMTACSVAVAEPGGIREMLLEAREGATVYDAARALPPHELADAARALLETDAAFGPGTKARRTLLRTLVAAPLPPTRIADDAIIEVLLAYAPGEIPASNWLVPLQYASPALRERAFAAARPHWLSENSAEVSNSLIVTAHLGGVSTEEDLALLRRFVVRPQEANPTVWEHGDPFSKNGIPMNAAFVLASSSFGLDDTVEWAAGLRGEAQEAMRGGMLSQMLVEDGAFANAAPRTRKRWLEVFDGMLRDATKLKFNDYVMPLILVMQRHPECAGQVCDTLLFLRTKTDDQRSKDVIEAIVRKAGFGDSV